MHQILLDYRPSPMVARDSLFKGASGLLEEEAVLERSLLTTKAGCLGTGSVTVSLLSITTATAMVGRSFGSSCTHKSSIFTHLKNSFVLHVSLSVCSINSNTLSSFHSFHAWECLEEEGFHGIYIKCPKDQCKALT